VAPIQVPPLFDLSRLVGRVATASETAPLSSLLPYGSDKAATRQQRLSHCEPESASPRLVPAFVRLSPTRWRSCTYFLPSCKHFFDSSPCIVRFGDIRSLADQSSSAACYTAPPADGINP